MNKSSASLVFTTRPTITLELPLNKHTRILHPEQVILKIADKHQDIGALCYALRSEQVRKCRQPKEVVISSLIKQRPKQILQIIKALSNLITDGGKAANTAWAYSRHFHKFIDLADSNGLHNCLAGGEATRNAFCAWATDTLERYRRQQFCEGIHNARMEYVCELLEATTGLDNLLQGIRKFKRRNDPNGGTEPLALHDFAHANAINQCLFDGLCDLVLEQRSFPYKLILPESLGWAENHFWLFPTKLWRLPHALRDDAIRAKMGPNASWPYDYENGRLATVDEIEHRYNARTQTSRRRIARKTIKKAKERLDEANTNPIDKWRLMLGMVAQRAFMFLFFCNTGGNAQVVRDLETDGSIDLTVQNQQFRTLKWRAGGKEVTLLTPATFMPRLRRFMELRQYLLQDRKTPYLFFGLGRRKNSQPAQSRNGELENHYNHVLLEIDPQLPRMAPRALRASVDDYYLRFHDGVVAAAIMGHTPETELKKYGRGSANDHHEEMTLFMASVAESAKRQRIVLLQDVAPDSSPLEEGGRCAAFGSPESLSSETPVRPDCRNSQGCLFCNHRVLIAEQEDARKVASAAYVMEQLILGPKHENALRPSIAKCDEDLEKMAAFPNCRTMVDQIRKDVYENENLTPFWADKYHLFLELGIIS